MMMTLWQALGLTDDGTQPQLTQPSFALQPNQEEGELLRGRVWGGLYDLNFEVTDGASQTMAWVSAKQQRWHSTSTDTTVFCIATKS